jgi:hypothetical protein
MPLCSRGSDRMKNSWSQHWMELSGRLHARAALPPGKIHQYPKCRRLVGPQSRCGRCDEEKNLSLVGNPTPFIQSEACRYTDWGIPAPFVHPTVPISSRISTVKRTSWLKQCFLLERWSFHGVTSILTPVSDFPQYLHKYSRTVPWIKPWSLPSIFSLIPVFLGFFYDADHIVRRQSSWHNCDTLSVFSWTAWRKPQKSQQEYQVGAQAEILTTYHSNKSLDRYWQVSFSIQSFDCI